MSSLDQLCKEHDRSYALNEDIDIADETFIQKAWEDSLTGKLFSSMVKTNKNIRGMNNRPKLRGSVRTPPAQSRNELRPSVAITRAPTSFGSQIMSVAPKIRATKNGIIVRSRDLVLTLKNTLSAVNNELVGAIPLNPAYFTNGSFSEYTPFYESFRIIRGRFTYITSAATTNGGEVFMYCDENPAAAVLNSQGSAFPAKLMSTKNAVMGPLWLNTSLDYTPSSKDYKLLNPITNASLEESTYGTLYVFQINPGTNPGYIMADFEIEFLGKRNTSLQSSLAYITPYTYVSRVNVADILAVPTQGTDVVVNTFNISPNPSIAGTIYKFILDSSNSIYGSTPGNCWQLSLGPASPADTITLANGTVVYALVQNNTTTKLYWSYTAAAAGFTIGGAQYTNAIQYGSGILRTQYAFWQCLVYAPGRQSIGV